MKKIAVLLALMLVSVAGFAQDTTSKSKAEIKAEIKAQRKAEKVEQKRVQDSIFQAQQAEYARIRREREMKEGATALIAKTPFESKKEILDLLVHSMITNGITPASIDKDYYIITAAGSSNGNVLIGIRDFIGFSKNPTENIVETPVSTDNEIEKIVLENHELNSTAITHK